jgi:lysophospholipase
MWSWNITDAPYKSGNATAWADGSSLIATKNRTTLFPSAYSFPPVPSTPASFVSSNLTTRPTFFGCDTSTSAPLVIYIANGGPPRNAAGPPLTNVSTDQLAVEPADLQAMLDQTWAIATQGNSGSNMVDAMWPACLACAVVDRARNRSGVAREGSCASCFDRYCWADTSSGNISAQTTRRTHRRRIPFLW